LEPDIKPTPAIDSPEYRTPQIAATRHSPHLQYVTTCKGAVARNYGPTTALAEEVGSTSFSEEKEAKRLYESGPGALASHSPYPRVIKVFCAAFFQKSGCLP
jgi:hypothetical protein